MQRPAMMRASASRTTPTRLMKSQQREGPQLLLQAFRRFLGHQVNLRQLRNRLRSSTSGLLQLLTGRRPTFCLEEVTAVAVAKPPPASPSGASSRAKTPKPMPQEAVSRYRPCLMVQLQATKTKHLLVVGQGACQGSSGLRAHLAAHLGLEDSLVAWVSLGQRLTRLTTASLAVQLRRSLGRQLLAQVVLLPVSLAAHPRLDPEVRLQQLQQRTLPLPASLVLPRAVAALQQVKGWQASSALLQAPAVVVAAPASLEALARPRAPEEQAATPKEEASSEHQLARAAAAAAAVLPTSLPPLLAQAHRLLFPASLEHPPAVAAAAPAAALPASLDPLLALVLPLPPQGRPASSLEVAVEALLFQASLEHLRWQNRHQASL
mmetsp:Transcript_56759/g.135191  ORF Transcript_56759/g.135191 Transcript_56759/m.135191 type:complete len:378 (+) Transcript_56759:1434-2567(+)